MVSGLISLATMLMMIAAAIWLMFVEPLTAFVIIPPVLWWIGREIKRRRAFAKAERENAERWADRFYLAGLEAQAKREASAKAARAQEALRHSG